MDISYYATYDLPVPYKDLLVYPATVKDYMLFNVYAQCLTFDKNTIPNKKVISMTNLEYMFYSAENEEKDIPYLLLFDRLLSICLKDDESFRNPEESLLRYKYDTNKKPFFEIKSTKYTPKDFDELKIIICEQNMIELPDETISSDVRKSLEKAREYKKSLNKSKTDISLEDYIVSLSVATGWSIDDIYKMSIRKFIKSIQRYDNLIHYKIYLTASMSGMVEFKDTSFIKHWLSNLDDADKYNDVSIDLDKVKDKVSLESAKAK
jgi:hypothetical protein